MRRPRPRGRAADRAAGFTLLELLVVLVIAASLSMIAYAGITVAYPRVKAAYERDDLERQLLELPQRVRTSGRGGILTSRSGDDLPEDAIALVEGVPEAEKAIEDWRVLRLPLPGGWRMRVAAPVFYHFNGSCEGGEVTFEEPWVSLSYVLAPPLCRPIRRDVR